MARVREESMRHGTREGMIRGLAVTGAVITSAGIVLAGTFSVLAVLPLVALTAREAGERLGVYGHRRVPGRLRRRGASPAT